MDANLFFYNFGQIINLIQVYNLLEHITVQIVFVDNYKDLEIFVKQPEIMIY